MSASTTSPPTTNRGSPPRGKQTSKPTTSYSSDDTSDDESDADDTPVSPVHITYFEEIEQPEPCRRSTSSFDHRDEVDVHQKVRHDEQSGGADFKEQVTRPVVASSGGGGHEK